MRVMLASVLLLRGRLLEVRLRSPSISWWLEMKLEFLFLLTFITASYLNIQRVTSLMNHV